ncbi:MAG TPA: sulfotransferase [Actinomycetota bacterium]|nr:sulfotransferase [Actinomycetota bacterium]
MSGSDVTVLYLGGLGRSGSTLLDRLLGGVPGFCPVGELVFLWQRGLIDGERCGCGEPLGECAFWSRVGKEAFGGWDSVDAREMEAVRRRVDRNRFIPWMLVPGTSPRAWRESLTRYADALGKLYRGVATASGASVIVDSSKHASTAILLRRVPGVDLRLAHLVRDPRGVAHSWARVVERPDAVEGASKMARLGPSRVAARWFATNLMFEALRASGRGRPSMRLRYEDVVDDPGRQLSRLLTIAGRADAGLGNLNGHHADLTAHHTVSGNPLRFHSGPIEIRADDRWRHAMSPSDRWTVTALTAPLWPVYGYGRSRG